MIWLLPVVCALASLPFSFRPLGRHRVSDTGERRGCGDLDLAVAADLLRAGLAVGASVPSGISSLGAAAEIPQLEVFSRCLIMGIPWSEAMGQVSGPWQQLLQSLEPAWTQGVCPQLLLTDYSQRLRASRKRSYREAAAKLGGRLILPLTICYLPAFVLLAMVPVMWQGISELGG